MAKATERPTTIPTTRRAMLAGAPAAAAAALAGGTVANAVVIGMAKAGEVDPIFAVIAEHREAVRVWGLDWDDDEEKEAKAADQWFAAMMALLTTQPTTVAGLSALLVHVGQPEFLKENEHEVERDSVLSGASVTADLEKAAQDFPLHVAAALRNIVGRGQA